MKIISISGPYDIFKEPATNTKYDNPECVILFHKGNRVGAVSATYDLSDIPEEFRNIVTTALSGTISFYNTIPVEKEEVERETRKFLAIREYLDALQDRPLWKKLLGIDPALSPETKEIMDGIHNKKR